MQRKNMSLFLWNLLEKDKIAEHSASIRRKRKETLMFYKAKSKICV